jgi:hypothetical protein
MAASSVAVNVPPPTCHRFGTIFTFDTVFELFFSQGCIILSYVHIHHGRIFDLSEVNSIV